MPKTLLTVPHQKQQNEGDCLAACAAMVLDYLNRSIDYPQLLQLLKIKPFGAPASHVRFLEQLNLSVTYRVTDMGGIENLLAQGQPIIVFVRTGELPYWDYSTDHAIVVVGIDDATIYVNDPYFTQAPIAVSRGDFELAWLERDYYYALITQ
ncbi:MAG: C39 family peptidase [Anaerolineae bacterium]|nr:C39 family peptidase [Anaerolineae bacterium]